MTTESELLQASLAGSTEAFGSIIERYQSLICGITYSATGNLSKSEELAQETFMRAWKGLAGLKEAGKFRGWLCTIARNVVIWDFNRFAHFQGQKRKAVERNTIEGRRVKPVENSTSHVINRLCVSYNIEHI